MPEKQETYKEPDIGDWAEVRRVYNDDYTDEFTDSGVIVGKPRKANGWHYDVLNPYEEAPFQGHKDGAKVIPDDDLSENERWFKQRVTDDLKQD